MATRIYTSGLELISGPSFNWETADIRALLLDNAGSYTFDPDHEFINDLNPGTEELSGSGYDRIALDSKSINKDLTNDMIQFLADAVTWAELDAGTAKAAVVFLHVTDDTDSILISYHDGGFPQESGGGDFTMNWAGASDSRVIRIISPTV